MRDFDEAEALAQKEKDPFYLAAFTIQVWVGGLVQRAGAEYAEKKNAKDRSLQEGEGWRGFVELFEPVTRKGFGYLLSCLIRFCASDDAARNCLRAALLALKIEHRHNPTVFSSSDPTAAPTGNRDRNDAACRTIVRWCDWLDAAIHLRMHRHWHAAPACFDPDPETRLLAALGNAERHLARLDARARMSWLCDFTAAAAQFRDSPKWAVVGKAMGDESDRLWTYAEVDTLVISLWPLVKQYNWTYRDLLKVIRPGLKRPKAYPCAREQEFAAYCPTVLGLHKNGRGRSAKDGKPAGCEIARELCPGLRGKAEG